MAKQARSDRSAADGRNDDVVLASPPSGRARLVINLFIISWLAWQLVVPLAYYLGDTVDDERFTWRMFSGVWLVQKSCTATVTEFRSPPGAGVPDMREVKLNRVLHSTWVNQLRKKNRRLVVEKFLPTRCEADPSVTEVEYVRTCPAAPHPRIRPATLRLDCRAGTFTAP